MIQMIPIGKLFPHPDNPRKDLGNLIELTQSIKQSGVMQNLTVVKRYGEITGEWLGTYTVIIGHRRLGASKIAGLTELPCTVVEMSPEEQVATMLAENMQRVDLTLYEQAQGLQLMFDFGETIESVSQKTGLSASTVRRRKKLLDYEPDTLKAAMDSGATLTDLAELEEIEDISMRNICLDKFGQSDYRWFVNKVLREQKTAKKMKEIHDYLVGTEVIFIPKERVEREELKCLGAIWAYEENYSIEKYTDRPLYCVDDDDRFMFYTDKPEETDEDRASSEAEWRKREAQEKARKKLVELTAIAYETRKKFIDSVTNKDCMAVLPELVTALITADAHSIRRFYGDLKGNIAEMSGLDFKFMIQADAYTTDPEKVSYADEIQNITEQTHREPAKYLFLLLMARLDPGPNDGYFYSYYYYPCHNKVLHLDEVYRILCLMGYEMSEEEKALQDGSHEVFDKD